MAIGLDCSVDLYLVVVSPSSLHFNTLLVLLLVAALTAIGIIVHKGANNVQGCRIGWNNGDSI